MLRRVILVVVWAAYTKFGNVQAILMSGPSTTLCHQRQRRSILPIQRVTSMAWKYEHIGVKRERDHTETRGLVACVVRGAADCRGTHIELTFSSAQLKFGLGYASGTCKLLSRRRIKCSRLVNWSMHKLFVDF